jgi:tetratricopeptide (TPR) repeat protein
MHGARAAFAGLAAMIFQLACGCATERALPSSAVPADKPAAARNPARETPRTATAALEFLQEARSRLEIGSPRSIRGALTLLDEQGLSQSEYGRMMNAIAALMLERVYPDSGVAHAKIDLPQGLPYTKIIAEVQRGVWLPPAASADYFTNLLPCLILTSDASPQVNAAALPYLKKARESNPQGVLAAYLTGLVYERDGQWYEARQWYDKAAALSDAECYPAFLGITRILYRLGKNDEAIALLVELIRLYPNNVAARRQLANNYLTLQEWNEAGAVIAAVLALNYRNPEFLLMQTRVFIELGQYNQALLPLDTYVPAGGQETNRNYLFLRARLAWEGNHSRSAAVVHLRAVVAANPNDMEALVYLARLLLGSNQESYKTDGRQMLKRLLAQDPLNREVLRLSMNDAIGRRAWVEADGYLDSVMRNGTPALSDMQNAVTIKTGLQDRDAALQYARDAASAFPQAEDVQVNLIGMLVDSEKSAERSEGEQLIEAVLPALKTAKEKSRVYFYRSRLRARDEDALSDLRASLLEDPRNVNALLAIIAVYDQRKDTRRVVFYLQQALVLAPDNPEVNRLKLVYQQ